MFIITIFLIVLMFIAILLLYLNCQKPKGYPPGPRWWPIFGCTLEMARIRREVKYFCKTCTKLSDKYGPIVSLKIGRNRVVVMNDEQSMRAMFLNEDCGGRPTGILYKARTSGIKRGIITLDEQVWAEQRRFVTRHLREFGFSRTGMTALVEDEARKMLEHLMKLPQDIGKSSKINNNRVNNNQIYNLEKDDLDKSELRDKCNVVEDEILEVKTVSESREMIIEMIDIFDVNVLNTIWRMIVGKRFETDNQKLIARVKGITRKTFAKFDMFASVFSYFPMLRFLIPKMSSYKTFIDGNKELWNFIEEELQYYKKTLDPNAPRGLIDVYLIALKSENYSDSFNESQLIGICLDLIMASFETTSKALAYGFLNLLLFPRVQKKAQEEIDRVIGRDRLPTLTDKAKLPYLQAVVLESIRIFMGYSFGISHRTLKDTTILGYKIPKNTVLMTNYNGLLYGDQSWGDSENFRPERFLDNDNNIVIPSNYLPFGLGKRHCLGEMLAKNNMFITMSILLQKFNFSVVPGEPQPCAQDFIEGITACPKPFKALVSLRV